MNKKKAQTVVHVVHEQSHKEHILMHSTCTILYDSS